MTIGDMRKAELKKIIKTIDEEMVREEVPVEDRMMQVLERLAKRLQTKIVPRPHDELYQVVLSWYEKKYGSKVKAVQTMGVLAILIRDKVYKMTIPLIHGQAQAVVDPNSETKKKVKKGEGREPDVVYVLNCIEALRPEQAEDLGPMELKELLLYFTWSVAAFQSIKMFSGVPLIREAIVDLQDAVDHLLEGPRAFGKSKWASQQAAEKFLKGFIAMHRGTVDKQAGLSELVAAANSLGLRPVNPDNLEVLKCDPKVRSGEVAVSAEEAVEAHHASIDICANVASSARK